MADKTLPPEGLSGAQSTRSSARRAFLRRAVGVGVPVVLATVRGRTVMALDTTANGSGCGSMHNSGWLSRDDEYDPVVRRQECIDNGYIAAEPGDTLAQPDPVFDLTPEPEPDDSTGGGKGWGKGGSKK